MCKWFNQCFPDIIGLVSRNIIGGCPVTTAFLSYHEPPRRHSELVEESPAFTTHFVRVTILSYNLLVLVDALLLSLKIPRSFHFLRITGLECYTD